MTIEANQDCPHCKFIAETFPDAAEMTPREYWLMTEAFVYLHGRDSCDGKADGAGMIMLDLTIGGDCNADPDICVSED